MEISFLEKMKKNIQRMNIIYEKDNKSLRYLNKNAAKKFLLEIKKGVLGVSLTSKKIYIFLCLWISTNTCWLVYKTTPNTP